MTTLPVTPGAALVLLILMLGATALVALMLGGRLDHPRRLLNLPPELRPALVLLAVLAWVALFLATLAAAFAGAVAAIRDPGSAGLGLGGLLVALLGAPFLIWTTVLKQRNTDIQHRMAELSDASHFNDKIAAATEGLSARHQVTRVVKGKDGVESVLTEWTDDLVTRAAAIDRLEGLANERPLEAPRIARMLSIYVRELSRTHRAQDHPRTEWLRRTEEWYGPKQDPQQVLIDLGLTAADVTVEAQTKWARGLRPVRSDMERAAQTLGRLRRILGADDATLTIDLRGANLQGFDLSGLDYEGSQMQGARLEGARLVATYLARAELLSARLDAANMERAVLDGANLFKVSLAGSYLWGAQLAGANLERARLESARPVMATFNRANLTEVRIDAGTRFTAAKFEGTIVSAVDFSQTRLTDEQLDSMSGDPSVLLPVGRATPAHWNP